MTFDEASSLSPSLSLSLQRTKEEVTKKVVPCLFSYLWKSELNNVESGVKTCVNHPRTRLTGRDPPPTRPSSESSLENPAFSAPIPHQRSQWSSRVASSAVESYTRIDIRFSAYLAHRFPRGSTLAFRPRYSPKTIDRLIPTGKSNLI